MIIHNAPFDTGFLNYELQLLGPDWGQVESIARIIDTLTMAREKHPGQKNSLDALCQRYDIDNSQREQHGALLDAQILSDVYLAMTGGQATLILGDEIDTGNNQSITTRQLDPDRPRLRVILPDDKELHAHEKRLAKIQEKSSGRCVWLTGREQTD